MTDHIIRAPGSPSSASSTDDCELLSLFLLLRPLFIWASKISKPHQETVRARGVLIVVSSNEKLLQISVVNLNGIR